MSKKVQELKDILVYIPEKHLHRVLEIFEEQEKELNETKGQKDFWLRNYSLKVSEHNKEIEGIRGQLTAINNQLLKLIKE